jgi:hypothetical protein
VKLKRKQLAVMVGMAVAGMAFATTQVIQFTINTPIALSDNANGDKPKMQRAGSGLLVMAYGDSPVGAANVYDVKANVERKARDIYVKTCNSLTTNCDVKANWAGPINISNSASHSSTGLFDWRGTLGAPSAYPGDIDKPNIKTSGSVMVLTWVSKYCPDGDLVTPGIQPSVQRAIKYLEREERVIPFSCTWMAYSANSGASWKPAKQLSTGERDAIQDASSGTFDSVAKTGRVAISWQEDPQGLQLGEADGPGDGASGANVNGGTDVWYANAAVDLNQAAPASGSEYSTAYFNLQPAVRLTDNQTGFGINGSVNYIYNGAGANVAEGSIEKGQAGAARPNIGMVGGTAVVAYEETKGSIGLDEGKFIRYHSFPYASPPATVAGKAGCIISDPLKNARRVRFLTQSAADATGGVAGASGINIALFWKEGAYDKGGPSDIRVRRGMVDPAIATTTQSGLAPSRMVPAVDPACETSDYTTAIGLTSAKGDNISSRATVVTAADTGLTDDTEANYTENALAHRGVLRGNDLWIGYSYTSDLVRLWAQLDNYNFWVRKFTFNGATGSWGLPVNLTKITDTKINVREPRFFGTPSSSSTACPTGIATDPTTTDPTLCQNQDVIFVAWGTQTNVSPYDPVGGEDLGIYITASNDAGATYATPVRYSTAMGSLFQDDESAYEAQIVARPDGRAFFGAWNQANATTGETMAMYSSGSWALVDAPTPAPAPTTGGGGGGCALGSGDAPFDPVLPMLAALGLVGLGLRQYRRN